MYPVGVARSHPCVLDAVKDKRKDPHRMTKVAVLRCTIGVVLANHDKFLRAGLAARGKAEEVDAGGVFRQAPCELVGASTLPLIHQRIDDATGNIANLDDDVVDVGQCVADSCRAGYWIRFN